MADEVVSVLGDEDQATRAAAALIRWALNFRYEYVGEHVFTLLPSDSIESPKDREDEDRMFRTLVETA